ncbi:MAG: hypothetical protein GEV13_27290 [Rhodospirillales bacterium]|nr:hypothetical protein [Rhodospirillales bacterium]
MALVDDLKDYIARNSTPTTVIKEKHNVVIVGETHAFLKTSDSEIRTKAAVRLLLELLADVNCKYFANESYVTKGKIQRGVDDYLRTTTLPPAFDPKQTNLDIEEIGKRVLVRRYLPVLDFIRANPRYILNIGSLIEGDGRDAALAQNFLDEFKTRGLHLGDAGVILLGANHASATSDFTYSTVREILHKRGLSCVSIKVLTDFKRGDVPDDAVFEQNNKPLTDLTVGDIIRLTSLVNKTPVTIAVDRTWTNGRASPFWRLTFGQSKVSVAAQFEYIVLQKA